MNSNNRHLDVGFEIRTAMFATSFNLSFSSYSTLKMEPTIFSETLVDFQRNNAAL
jgi:hypothetical protein